MRLTGLGSQYLIAMHDSSGEYLDGARSYRLTLPPGIPESRSARRAAARRGHATGPARHVCPPRDSADDITSKTRMMVLNFQNRSAGNPLGRLYHAFASLQGNSRLSSGLAWLSRTASGCTATAGPAPRSRGPAAAWAA